LTFSGAAVAPPEFDVQSLSRHGTTRETGFHSMLADMPGQRLPAPDFGRVARILRFRARHVYDPGFGIVANHRLFGPVVIIFQRRHRPHSQGLRHPFRNAQPRHPQTATDAGNALTGVIPQQNRRALRLPIRRRARPSQLRQFRLVFVCQDQPWSLVLPAMPRDRKQILMVMFY
jgi:hypothetical protein